MTTIDNKEAVVSTPAPAKVIPAPVATNPQPAPKEPERFDPVANFIKANKG